MDVEENDSPKKFAKKIRVKIITNRNLQFITSVRPEATISELANRALSVYLELTGQSLFQSSCKKQLTVAAVKQGVFFMPKSECVSNILNQDDVVEVVIIKAKPKYPNGVFTGQQESTKKQANTHKMGVSHQKKQKKQIPVQEEEQALDIAQPELVPTEIVESKKPQQSISKRQRKKDKKESKKIQKKKKLTQQKEAKLNIESAQLEKQMQELQSLSKEKQLSAESFPKKKLKLEKDQVPNSSQKITPQLVVPSPKITFHADPKMDSPRNFNLGEAHKKKVNFDTSKFQQEDNSKKTPLQRILSPQYPYKSPFVSQKTPVNNQNLQASGKQKEKEELLNFSLPRKASQDKRLDLKKEKINEPLNDSKVKKQVITQIKENNTVKSAIESSNEKNKQSKQIKNQIISDEQKTSEKIGQVKQTKSLVILQPESDSESEQKKNIEQNIHQNHRYKQLFEISSKIKKFIIESDQEQQQIK